MKLEHLTNKSATNLHAELSLAFTKAGEFSIATAFINDEAIELIAASLKKNKKLQGRILIGLYNFFNKKKDLEALLQLVNSNPARLQVHISLDQCFHWKYYHFVSGQRQTFYIGSANFTTSGMADNRELVVKLSDNAKRADQSLQNLEKSFEKEWLHSRPLTEFPLQHYKEAERPIAPAGGTHKEIIDFFNKKTTSVNSIESNGKSYAICLDAGVSNSTYQAIEKQKNEWVKNKWDWFILPTKQDFESCIKQKYAFVFIKEGKNNVHLYLSEIVANDSNIKTVDGHYFIAYKILKHQPLMREHLLALRKASFKIDLIGRNDPFYYRVLSENQTSALKKELSLNAPVYVNLKRTT
jgi:HKD family nuclease